jgi:hypothetical protein
MNAEGGFFQRGLAAVKASVIPPMPAAFQTALGSERTIWSLPFLLGLVVLLIVVLVVFVVIRQRTEKPFLFQGPTDTFTPKSVVLVNRAESRKNMNGSYTLSFYLRIDSVPDMRSGGTHIMRWPGTWDLYYVPGDEHMKWVFNQTPDENPNQEPTTVMLPGATLQRWNQYTLSFEGRSVDLYINGTLVKSALLENVPPSESASISIVPNMIMGQVAYVQLWPRRLTTTEVASNYQDTSDSQGQPYFGPNIFGPLESIKIPNLFCAGGACDSATPTASASQTWEFPYQ